MKRNFFQWAMLQLKKMVNSIAFYPALIAFLFLGLSYIMIHFDYSEQGKQLKAQMQWLKLKDASTARTVISVIAGGILSLTVFSFTMVMVILNQAASQLSNRVLDRLIGNRYQQFVLGFYIGTIVYSLFLLSAIRDIDSGIYVPSLSTYLLITFAILDIFFFIYFLHYVTQSVKYAVLIRRIYKEICHTLKKDCLLTEKPPDPDDTDGEPLLSAETGVFNGFNKNGLLAAAKKADVRLRFIYPQGSYVMEGIPIAMLHPAGKKIPEKTRMALLENIFFNELQTIDTNVYYGFQQLTEVAVKALSPGINDPGTAVESLRALTGLLSIRLQSFPDNAIKDSNDVVRIYTHELTFEDIFNSFIAPIWEYGKDDLLVQREFMHLLQLLQYKQKNPTINKMLLKVQRHITEQALHAD